MDLKKQQEMQDNMDFVRRRMPKEVQLPPALQGQYLLQRAKMQTAEKKAPLMWKKRAVMACSLIFVVMAAVAVLPQSQNTESGNMMMAPKAAPMAYSAAPAECSVEDMTAMDFNVGIKIHTAQGEDAVDVLKELYPNVQIFSFNEKAKEYTVFSFHGEESHYLAFLGGTVGYDFMEDELLIIELDSGKTMRFDAVSYELLD